MIGPLANPPDTSMPAFNVVVPSYVQLVPHFGAYWGKRGGI